MSREVWSFGMCSLLSVVIMSGTYHWLEEKNTLTSDLALEKAEQTVQRYVAQHGNRDAGMRLTEATAPGAKNRNWQFRFQPSQGRAIMVAVAENGKTSVSGQGTH